MRYWVYINDKVDGPFDEIALADVAGFTPETLICAEEANGAGNQEWVKASSIFEFDEANKTMTRTNMTDEEYNKLIGQEQTPAAKQEQTQTHTQTASLDNAATQLLIEKIDHLTREIEGMKGKLDEALAAAAAAQAEITKHNLALAAQAQKEQTQQNIPVAPSATQEETVSEEALITNTASLVNHAEMVVSQASTQNEEKPIDFLSEIQISDTKEENLADKGGEEVVLRSALDSLYGADKVQTEAEKESTFQDLLSPAQAAAVATAAVGTAAVVAASLGDDKQEETQQETPAQVPAQEPQTAETPEQPLTQEQRDELINEITAPAQQNDFIAQALQEAQQEQAAQQEAQAPVEAPAQEEPAAQTQAEPMPQLQEIAPAQEEQPLPQEKESLDLSHTFKMSIIDNEEAPAPTNEKVLDLATPLEEMDTTISPMGNPDEEPVKEITETIKELVPGKKLEDTAALPSEEDEEEEEGVLSQADLEEAFTERSPMQEAFPLPEDLPVQEDLTTPEAQEPAEEPRSYQSADEMTEVELKEGSTYLISDFIPPAQTKNEEEAKEGQDTEDQNQSKDATMIELTPMDQLTGAALSTVTAEVPDTITKNEKVQEVETVKDETDLTMSKIILENTIKTKRGATMDIKTVPMVKEPADTNRLDLSDSELADINAQHDLKSADIKPAASNTTKVILGSLVGVVLVAVIYVMLAYLEVLPAQFNLLKKGPSAEQIQAEKAQMQEMLGLPTEEVTVPENPFGEPQAMPQPVDGQDPLAAQAAAPADPLAPVLDEVKNYTLTNGQTLQQLISTKHPTAQNLIEWNITTAVEPQNYSILVKVPPENPQSFKISYRFNYNAATKALDPTISDSKNLLDSVNVGK